MISKKIRYGLVALLVLILASLLFILKQEKPSEKSNEQENKTSQVTSATTTDTTTSSQSQTQTTPQESSQESQLTSETSSQELAPANNQSQNILPQLVGTWKGSSPQASSITMTISSDGTIYAFSDYDYDEYGTEEAYASVSQATQVAPNTYRWINSLGNPDAFLPGVSGIGGAGMKDDFGFILEGNSLRPVLFFGPLDGEIDYNKPSDYGVVLTKQ